MSFGPRERRAGYVTTKVPFGRAIVCLRAMISWASPARVARGRKSKNALRVRFCASFVAAVPSMPATRSLSLSLSPPSSSRSPLCMRPALNCRMLGSLEQFNFLYDRWKLIFEAVRAHQRCDRASVWRLFFRGKMARDLINSALYLSSFFSFSFTRRFALTLLCIEAFFLPFLDFFPCFLPKWMERWQF